MSNNALSLKMIPKGLKRPEGYYGGTVVSPDKKEYKYSLVGAKGYPHRWVVRTFAKGAWRIVFTPSGDPMIYNDTESAKQATMWAADNSVKPNLVLPSGNVYHVSRKHWVGTSYTDGLGLQAQVRDLDNNIVLEAKDMTEALQYANSNEQ